MATEKAKIVGNRNRLIRGNVCASDKIKTKREAVEMTE